MRKFLLLTAVFVFGILTLWLPVPASAQVICTDCRGALRYPEDWTNAAYNNLVGDDSWLTAAQSDTYTMINLNGREITIDVNAAFEGVTIDLQIGLNVWFLNIGIDLGSLVVFPDDLIIQVIGTRTNGTTFEESYSVNANPDGGLPVGESSSSGGSSGGGDGGSGPPADPPPGDTGGGNCGTTQVDDGKKRTTCN